MTKTQATLKWATESVPTQDILLDSQNPRINCKQDATQDELRSLLLHTEKVLELAKNIVKTNGNMAGERIIVIVENGKKTVVEGNRRVCACQLLTNPKLIPATHRGKFPAIDDDLKARISLLDADIAPSREAAELIITRRHTEPGIEQWSPVAQHRRIMNLLASGKTIDEIAVIFGNKNKSSITKRLKEYAILEHAKKLTCWTPEEKKRLDDPQAKTNPFTRFMSNSKAAKTLGFKFDENTQAIIRTNPNEKTFQEAYGILAKSFLIPDSKNNGKPRFDTRATHETVFKQVFAGKKNLSHLSVKSVAAKVGTTPLKTDIFFENANCQIQDNRLLALTKEIKIIPYKTCPTAATFLLRALLESTLDWCIKEYKLNRTLAQEFQQARTKSGKQPPPIQDAGLDFIVRFCIRHNDDIFNCNVKRNLQHLLDTKNICDLVVHGKWIDANDTIVVTAASVIRPFIYKVFDRSILK